MTPAVTCRVRVVRWGLLSFFKKHDYLINIRNKCHGHRRCAQQAGHLGRFLGWMGMWGGELTGAVQEHAVQEDPTGNLVVKGIKDNPGPEDEPAPSMTSRKISEIKAQAYPFSIKRFTATDSHISKSCTTHPSDRSAQKQLSPRDGHLCVYQVLL